MTDGQVYFASDCDREILNGKHTAIVGYGSQGKAIALNLRDSSCEVTVVLRPGSPSRQEAESERLAIIEPPQTASFDIIFLAIPDHEQIGYYEAYLRPGAEKQRVIVLLHGLNFHFRNIRFAETEDVILLAPHGPGTDLRQLYVEGSGLSCFLAIGQDVSGSAHNVGLALGDALGCSAAGIYETTFAEETVGDLFGEQALLVGGLAGLTDAVMTKMVEAGLSPVNVNLETVKQLKLLAALLEEYGPAGMLERVSKTAALGSLEAIPRLFDGSFVARLSAIYGDVESGAFNQRLVADAAQDFDRFKQLLAEFKKRPAQEISERGASQRIEET